MNESIGAPGWKIAQWEYASSISRWFYRYVLSIWPENWFIRVPNNRTREGAEYTVPAVFRIAIISLRYQWHPLHRNKYAPQKQWQVLNTWDPCLRKLMIRHYLRGSQTSDIEAITSNFAELLHLDEHGWDLKWTIELWWDRFRTCRSTAFSPSRT